MISQHTKAPTFVSNHQDVMGMLDSYDKEFQRINQDYATASNALGQYRKSIDILKMPVKNYFDAKYNDAVSNFSSNIDLTKRGQVYKTQNLLDSITMDPIIKNGIQSTNNFRKINEYRQKINTDPKYAKARSNANEWVEQQEQEKYLKDSSLTASYTRTTPIVTINADEHYKGVLSKLPFEEKLYSDGITNVFSKVKSFQQGTDAIFKEITANPDIIAAERNNFEYQYQTPEAKAAFAKNFEDNKRTNISHINTSLADIAKILTVQNPEYHAAEIAQLKNQEANLLAQKQFLTSTKITPENMFQAYLQDKAFSYGISNISTKESKTEIDKAKKYFSDEAHKNTSEKLASAKFDFDKQKFGLDYDLKLRELAQGDEALKLKKQEGQIVDDAPAAVTRTTPNTVEYTAQTFKNDQQGLKESNFDALAKIKTAVASVPGTKLNELFTKWVSAGVINGQQKLRSDKDILDGIKLKEEILKQYVGKNTPLPPHVQDIVEAFDIITENNYKYKVNDVLNKKAAAKAGYDLNSNPGLFSYSTIGADKKENQYLANLKGYMDIRYQTIAVPIANLSNDTAKIDNRNIRASIDRARTDEGMFDSKGNRFRLPGTLNGSEKDLTGDTILDEKFVNSVDFAKSLGFVEIINGKPMVRLDLKPKGEASDAKIAGDNFKDGVAYIPVSPEFAQQIMNKSGQGSYNIYKMMQPSTVYDKIQTLELTDKEKNDVLSNKGGIFDLKHSTFGGFHALVKPLSINGTYQINYDFGKLGTIVARTNNIKEFNSQLKLASDNLVQSLKNRNQFTPENFKLELERLIPGIQQTVR